MHRIRPHKTKIAVFSKTTGFDFFQIDERSWNHILNHKDHVAAQGDIHCVSSAHIFLSILEIIKFH